MTERYFFGSSTCTFTASKIYQTHSYFFVFIYSGNFRLPLVIFAGVARWPTVERCQRVKTCTVVSNKNNVVSHWLVIHTSASYVDSTSARCCQSPASVSLLTTCARFIPIRTAHTSGVLRHQGELALSSEATWSLSAYDIQSSVE